MCVASDPCVRANCTTAPMPSPVMSLFEKSIAWMGNGLVRSVWNPVILAILCAESEMVKGHSA